MGSIQCKSWVFFATKGFFVVMLVAAQVLHNYYITLIIDALAMIVSLLIQRDFITNRQTKLVIK